MTTQIWLEHRDKAIYGMYIDTTSSVSELGGGGVLTLRLDELQSIENQELPSTLKCV